MKAADIFPSKWLSASDLGDAEPTVIIDHVVLEEVSQTDRKPVLYFRGKVKGMVCNKTNWKRIEYILKSDDSDDWTGQAIKLYVELVDMQGQMKPALRVKAPDKRDGPKPDKAAPPRQVSVAAGSVERQPVGPNDDAYDDPIPF